MTRTPMHTHVDAEQLGDGYLIHVGGTTYVMAAHAEAGDDGRIAVTVYEGDVPHTTPTLFYDVGEQVQVSLRSPALARR
ncbi:hypothetical protein [Nonomuraea sp. NPDC050202]|uniref:hypothetical protein n=1 Tax=Nonomuraea sp. NPDC050202 TaxID=3155035 RepID=UPI0033CF6363